MRGRRCSLWTWPTSFRRSVTVYHGGEEPGEADGKSVMQMIILAATEGTPLRIEAEGDDAEQAVAKTGRIGRRQVWRRMTEQELPVVQLSVAR